MLPFMPRAHIDDEDPYRACHQGFTEHPHYHDCDNCAHYRYLTCDLGKIYLFDVLLEAQNDETDRLLAEIRR